MHSLPEFSKSSPAAAAAAGPGTARGRGSVPDEFRQIEDGDGAPTVPDFSTSGAVVPSPSPDKSGTGPQPAGGVRAAWPPCSWGQLSDKEPLPPLYLPTGGLVGFRRALGGPIGPMALRK